MLKFLNAKGRITAGLVSLMISALCFAMMGGIVPDRAKITQSQRNHICEVLAFASSDYMSRGDFRKLDSLLELIAKRNPEIISIGLRNAHKQLVTQVGPHQEAWFLDEERSPGEFVVPIRSGKLKWGNVEVKFSRVNGAGLIGFFQSDWFRLSCFLTVAAGAMFYFYLGKMLKHLDPSKSVPKRVRAALDSLAEGLLVIDRNNKIMLANQSFSNWIGKDPERLIGTSTDKIAWLDLVEDGPPNEMPWETAIREERAQAAVMLRLRQANDSMLILMANASPVLGHDGQYRGVLVSFDDVTQLEATKSDLQDAKRVAEQAQQDAEQANRAKSDFLARMSHEIRTPMNAILGYTEVLQRGYADDETQYQSHLVTIQESGEHLLAIINDILDLSKIESGVLDLEIAEYSLHEILTQVISVLKIKAQEKDISLGYEIQTPIPQTIRTDRVRLRQTIINLVGNAIKFTEQGSVTICPSFQRNANGNPQISIAIVDTGIGMSVEATQRIFDPFSQADNSITRRFGGTGLGLSISRQLAEAMGGSVSVTSEEGVGSTFLVTIDPGPIDDKDLRDASFFNTSQHRSEKQQITTEAKLPNSRILVADDGAANRKLVELFLRRSGAQVTCVENGQEAVEAIEAQPFDMVLMDMQMPIMDGLTATKVIRDLGIKTPIIALTANVMQDDENRCYEAGCNGFLTKPIKMDLLLETLVQYLGNAETSPPNCEFSEEHTEISQGSDVEGRVLSDCKNSDSGDPPIGIEQEIEIEVREMQEEVAQISESVTQVDEPIYSVLPTDDDEIAEIVEDFIQRLKQKISNFRESFEARDFKELRELAHWLKGSGESVGFSEFTEPARDLEELAKSEVEGDCASLIARLENLTQRVRCRDEALIQE